jgi:hypothetical protein
MQRILFHKIHDIKNKLFIIIHADKNECSKETSFSHTKPQAFSRALHFETKGHLMTYFHRRPHLPNTRANNLFSKKENNQGVARFQKQIVLDSHRNNFCFQNARSRFQDSF